MILRKEHLEKALKEPKGRESLERLAKFEGIDCFMDYRQLSDDDLVGMIDLFISMKFEYNKDELFESNFELMTKDNDEEKFEIETL